MKKVLAIGGSWNSSLVGRLSAALAGWTVLQGADHDRTIARNADVLVPLGMSVDRRLLEDSNVRLVHQFGVGLNGIDLAAARELGVAVCNAPSERSGMAASVAEGAVHLVLSCARLPRASAASIDQGNWNWAAPLNLALGGKTAGLIGLGAIGTEIAVRLGAFGMRLIAIRRSPEKPSPRSVLIDWIAGVDDLHALVAESDFIIVCAPLSDATEGLIDASVLAGAKPTACIVNVGRGRIVDESALLHALDHNLLHAAGLDTVSQEPLPLDSPLLRHPRIVLTPHTAGVTERAFDGVAAILAENIRRLEGDAQLVFRVA